MLPFAQIPYALLKDRRLTPDDKVIVGLLLERLGKRAEGWILNDALAKGANVKVRSAIRSLKRVQSAGWIRCVDTPGKRSKRMIVALWRLPGFVVPAAETAEDPDTDVMVNSDSEAVDPDRGVNVTLTVGSGSTLTVGSPNKQLGKNKEENKVVLSTTTTTAPESSSLSFDHRKDSSDGITTQEPDLGALVASVLEVVKPFDFAEKAIRLAVAGYSAEWVALALEAARQVHQRDGSVTWAYIAAVLRNWKAQGFPSPPSGYGTAAVPLNRYEAQKAKRVADIARRKAEREAAGADENEPDIAALKAAKEREAALRAAAPYNPHEARMAALRATAERRKLERLAREEESQQRDSAMAS